MHTLWLLIKLRFLSFFGGNKKNKAKKRLALPMMILLGFALLYLAVVFLGLFALIFGLTLPAFLSAGEPFAYFALMSLIAMAVMLFGSIIFTQSQLFEAGDNAFLLSLPIPPHMILASRMIFLLLLNYLMQALVFFPGIIIWLLGGAATFGNVLLATLSFLILPFPALAISCLLGWCFAKITAKIKHKQLVAVLFSILFFVGYFWLLEQGEAFFEELATSAILPFIDFLKKALPFAVFGRAALGSFLHFLLVLAVSALLFGGVYYWLTRTFFKTVLTPVAHVKKRYRERSVKQTSALWALTKKELFYLSSSSGYMMNACLGLLFLLIVPIVMLVKGDIVAAVATEMPEILGALPVLAALISCLLSSMTMLSASSVSLEGRALWIVRTSPVPTKTILLSKALLHILPTAVAVFVGWVLFVIALKPALLTAVLMLLCPLAFAFLSAFVGLSLNLLFPKLEWNNMLIPIKQGLSTFLSMLVNGILGMLPLFGGFVLALLLPPFLVLGIITLLYGGMAALLWLWLAKRGVTRFEALV